MSKNFSKKNLMMHRGMKSRVNFGTSDSEADNSDTMSINSRISGLKSTFSR